MRTARPFVLAWILLPVAFLALPGCAAGLLAAGAAGTYGAIKFMDNEASRAYPASLRATWEASLAALPEFGYPAPRNAQLGPTGGCIQAGHATLHVEAHPNNVTMVRARVGTFENAESQRRAGLLLERIGQKLGTP